MYLIILNYKINFKVGRTVYGLFVNFTENTVTFYSMEVIFNYSPFSLINTVYSPLSRA